MDQINEDRSLPVSNKGVFDLSSLFIDGKSAPDANELDEKLRKLNFTELLATCQIVSIDKTAITFSFDKLFKARLFSLKLGLNGEKKGLFQFGLSDDDSLLQKSFVLGRRLDGNYLAVSENEDSDQERIRLLISLTDSQFMPHERKVAFSSLLKETVDEITPHLSESVKNFSFS